MQINSFNEIIKSYPVLNKEDQMSLVKEWRESKSKPALDRLVLSNMRAVIKEAYKTKKNNPYLSYEDLVQEGVCGLIKAVDMYNEEKEVLFLTYAMWWIKANMRKYVMNYRSVVRMGTTRADRVIFSNLAKARTEAESLGLSGEEKINKMSEIMGVKKEKIYQMMSSLSGFDSSLDAPVKTSESDANSTLKVDLLKDPASNQDSFEEGEYNLYVQIALSDVIDSLPDEERTVIKSRYLTDSPKTLRELAQEMSISREWVRKIEIKALDRVQKRLNSQYDISETM
tara:strand:+ start:390 stop:1241 length:852 start_codon:yes stop_codon:yes gene_type:complete